MKIKKQMQLLGLLNPAETPELKSAVTAIGNANTEAEIADILNGFTVKFIKTLAHYESIWNINGLKKSELVAKISRVIAARFNAINHRNIFRDYSPIDKVYLMRTQGITPDYIWNPNNWDKDNSDKSNPKYSACTYKLPNDDSQHELPATADDAISANDNDNALASQPAPVANAESSQPDALYMDDSFSDAPGDNSECARNQDFPVDIPNSMPDDNPGFTIWSADNGSFVFPYKSNKQNLSLSYTARLVHLELNDSNTKNYQGDYLLMFYDNNGNTSHPFALYAPMCNMFNFNPTSAILYDSFSNQDNFKNHVKSLLPVMLRGSSLIDENGEIISDGLEAFRVLFFKSVYLDTSSLPAQCRASENFIMPDNPFTTDNDKDNPLSWRESPYRVKALRILLDIQAFTFDAQNRWQGNKSAVKKLNKRIQALTADLHKLFDAQNVAIYAENPGFTIVPSEHIERPQYTTYPDTITDECPYVTVPACDIPDNHNSAADVVPHVNPITAATMRLASNLAALLFVVCKIIIPLMFMRKKDLRRVAPKFVFTVGYKYPAYFRDKQQIITISDRRTDKYGFSWLSFIDEDNISYNVRVKLRDDGYTELLDFKELEQTCYAFEGLKPVKESNRVKYIKFEVGRSYTAVSGQYYSHHEKHFTVLDRFSAVRVGFNDKFAHLKVRMTDSYHKDKSAVSWILVSVDRNIHAESYSCGYKINFRADNPDPVQEIHAETRKITPKSRKPESAPASVPADIEHKLIDTKELHFAEKRKALDHNAAVITSCMFSEAVISLLMSISAKAVIQLGFHMGLFIAKPKGKKNVIAELFAQRLIARRDIRANVRSKSDNTAANHTANVPDGVKFFVGARRQICFKFED